MSSPSDPYARLQYRRLIAWPARIEREWPLLEEVLESAPARRVLDLGCGTGEHARFLAEKGFDVIGIDRSAELIAEARQLAADSGSETAGSHTTGSHTTADEAGSIRFVEGDLTALDELGDPAGDGELFGAAVCLGNTLPHLVDRDALGRMARGLRRQLHPGSPFLLQILNYERIFGRDVRYLPVNFRREDDGSELVFLRLMQPEDDGMVVFCPSTLRFRPGEESPVELVSSRRIRLRGWRRDEVEEIFVEAGFRRRAVFGSFDRRAYSSHSSQDLILILH